jgi:hypothetical protein
LPEDAVALNPADLEFATIQHGLAKLVFSSSLEPASDRRGHQRRPGGSARSGQGDAGADIVLSCGPRTLAPLAATPGLSDEYVVAVHPA